MFLVTGLGNPGPSYRLNRHNAGYLLVDRLAERTGERFRHSLRHVLTSRTELEGQPVILAKPLTFMNLSGGAVLELLRAHPVDPANLLVVYDDFALPLGKIRIRPSGSSGGHKGMQAIINALGHSDVPRLRIGISTGQTPEDSKDFVLSDFRRSEMGLLEETLDRAADAVTAIVSEGIDLAMARFN